jgi:hypothetical protein
MVEKGTAEARAERFSTTRAGRRGAGHTPRDARAAPRAGA